MRGQNGSVVQKGKSYFIKYRGPDGKQKMCGSRPGRGFETQEEAKGRLHEILNDINKGDYIALKKITFKTFSEVWLDERLSIGGSTTSAYGSIIRCHLVPGLGTLQVHDIGYNQVNALVVEVAQKVDVKTLHNTITLLRVMLVGKNGGSAIKRGYIRHDPTKGVELPPIVRANIEPPTQQQVWQLVDTALRLGANSKCAKVGYYAVFLDAFTGLRRGEILALKYSDIDWFAREITVSKSIAKVKAKDGAHKWTWIPGQTKNKRTRRVGVGEKVLRVLAGLKQTATNQEGLIFTPSAAGLPIGRHPFIDPDYFNEYIYGPIAVEAALAKFRFHDLRHFFASMLIAQGETAKYVCDQLGHSSIQVTFDTYGHLFPQAKKEASSRLEVAMFGTRTEPIVETPVETVPDQPARTTNRGRAN